MSVSADVSSTPVNLYCHEAAGDALYSNNADDISEINCSLPSADFPLDIDKSYIDHIFDSELQQKKEMEFISQFLEISEPVSTAHQDVVNWMLKVRAYYRFRPETAYLSVSYLHHFISSHSLPQGKGWPLQLLAVACLSVAAKLEETRVPLLLDIQTIEPRFLFKPSTVQKMEILVMSNLKWRLHLTTPFSFLHYFIAKLSHLSPVSKDYVLTQCSDFIISTCKEINVLAYTPSAIAAAAVLWATDDQIIDDNKLEYCFHSRVNGEMVRRCYDLVKQNMSQLSRGNLLDSMATEKCQSEKFLQEGFQLVEPLTPDHLQTSAEN